jgi:hypothetical protein
MPEPTVGSWRQFPHSPDKEKTIECAALVLRVGLMPWGVLAKVQRGIRFMKFIQARPDITLLQEVR